MNALTYAPFTLPLSYDSDGTIIDADGKTVLIVDPSRDLDDDVAERIALQVLAALQAASVTPRQTIALIADCANVIGWQAGEPGMEIAGGIVSFLAAHPQHIDRFLKEPSAVMTDGTFDPHTGGLTWRAANGEMMNAETFAQRLRLKPQSGGGSDAPLDAVPTEATDPNRSSRQQGDA
ncbi:hypothetical protein [Brevundimonas diminuta]|uniref:hypothetical protein n=1 Tax=Brevundimonas diminuta TaxID=293 RepID=UPI003D9AA62D